MTLPEFSVKNSVLINMIMIIVFIVGVFTIIEIPKEDNPPVDFGFFIINVRYPGVSPAEMEELIVTKIEDEISDVDGIDFISSTAQEGVANISVRFEPGVDIDQAWNDINTELDKVSDLPEDAEDPIITRLNMREVNEMCDITLGGSFSGNAIREIAEDMKQGLLDIRYVSNVEIIGSRDREIWVEGDITRLKEYGLTLTELANVIKARNMNMPGGEVKFGRAEFLIRTIGEFESTAELAELIVTMDSNGRAVKLEDVATINDTLEEQSVISKLNGKESVSLWVYKDEDGNIIDVMKNVREYVKKFQQTVPGLETEVRNDDSIQVKNSISQLGTSALLGIILVFVVLLIFIGWRKALFAAWGIPFSFLLTFILMNYLDITINNLSLFALVVVLGMIVDDAIIVLENVHRYMEHGLCPRDAVLKGTNEIKWPIIAAVLTTISAFLPLLLMEGTMGQFLQVFPIVVSLALFASLVECLLILPSHIFDFSRPIEPEHKKERRHFIYEKMIPIYQKVLKFALGHRLLILAMVIALFIISGSFLALRLIQFEFFPKSNPKTIVLTLKTPVGTKLEKTEEVVLSIEDYILNMKERDDVEAVLSKIGMMMGGYRQNLLSSNAQLSIDLKEIDEMKYSHEEIKNSIRSYIETLPGIVSYNFDVQTHGPPRGKDVELRIKGDNLERLEYIGEVVKDKLAGIPGVKDITDDFEPGKEEIKIMPKYNNLRMHNLTVHDISNAIRISSYGVRVSKYRGTGIDEYDIIVRARPSQIDDLYELKNLRIRNNRGDLISLKDIADFVTTSGLAKINHRDKKRIITIAANTSSYEIDGRTAQRTSDEVKRLLVGGGLGSLSNFSERFPGYTMEFGGIVEQQRKSYRSLAKAFLVAVLVIFTILATQFKSYIQPLIVMITIPFGFIGVIFGLLITGLPFSLTTFIAVVALSGVVVNDSLVLLDFINKEREAGKDIWHALINAGSLRLRPIMLTTVTTIAGVLPMILSSSKSVAEWKPMAVSIAFGLAFATILTLFVIPVIYSLLDTLFGKLKMTRFKSHKSFDECMEEAGN